MLQIYIIQYSIFSNWSITALKQRERKYWKRTTRQRWWRYVQRQRRMLSRSIMRSRLWSALVLLTFGIANNRWDSCSAGSRYVLLGTSYTGDDVLATSAAWLLKWYENSWLQSKVSSWVDMMAVTLWATSLWALLLYVLRRRHLRLRCWKSLFLGSSKHIELHK